MKLTGATGTEVQQVQVGYKYIQCGPMTGTTGVGILEKIPTYSGTGILVSVLEKNRKKIALPRCIGLFFTTLVPTTLVPIMPTYSNTSTLSKHTAMDWYTKYRYTCPNHTDRYKAGTSIVQVSFNIFSILAYE